MGQKKKVGKNRLDKFYHLAKDQGYRSRAAFKLIQLNKKFDFLGKANVLLDLCAAPGSWLQVASKFMPAERTLVGVDLVAIKAVPNCVTLMEDITTQKCLASIKQVLKGKEVQVVLHDGAPNMGKGWIQDAYTQSELVLSALKLATEFLTKDGVFVSKVFRSSDYNSLLWVFHQLFRKVTSTKPTASRSVSAEIFVVCEGYLSPKKIDPRLLDSRYVFKELDMPSKQINLFAKKKAKPNKEGYDESAGQTLFKRCSALKFITSEDPTRILAEFNEIAFAPQKGEEEGDEVGVEEIKLYEQHPKTTPEIKACLADLKVLNAKDFRKLLKWRLEMRQFRAAAVKLQNQDSSGQDAESDSEKEVRPEKPHDAQQELDEHVLALAKAKKKKEKKRRKDQQKVRLRIGLMGDVDLGVDFEAPKEVGLFNLISVKNTDTLSELVGSTTAQQLLQQDQTDKQYGGESDADMDKYYNQIHDEQPLPKKNKTLFPEEEEGEEENEEKYLASGENELSSNDKVMEKYLDLLYNNYVTANQEYRAKLAKKLRRENLRHEEIPEDLTDFTKFVQTHDMEIDNDELDEEGLPQKKNPLIVPKEVESVSKRTSMWFNQDIFGDVEETITNPTEDDDHFNQLIKQIQQKRNSDLHGPMQNPQNGAQETNGGIKRARSDEEDDMEPPLKRLKNDQEIENNPQVFEENNIEEEYGGDDGDERNTEFDEVKVTDMLDEEEEKAFNDMDEDERAQILALGALMKDPQTRAAIIDKTVNKYAHDDTDSLPRWFTEDEKEHGRPQKPVTKEMVQEWKAKMKAIDAKTIKKVAEANARKKRLYLAKLEKAKSKARTIAASSDMSEHEKIKQIQKLYKGQLGKVKPAKVYVVAKKMSSAKLPASNMKIKLVDPRMKKDKRAKKAQQLKKDSKRKRRNKSRN